MIDPDITDNVEKKLAYLAGDIFASLAAQFPVCMASDEFHFFPQSKVTPFDWSRWDDFSAEAVESALGRLKGWEGQLSRLLLAPLSSATAIDADMLLRVVKTLSEQLAQACVHQTQPTFYLTVAGIGLAEAFEAGPRAFEIRLKHLPSFLDQARKNLNRIPRLFRELGIEMLEKQRKWLDSLALPEKDRAAVSDAYVRLACHLRQVDVYEDFLPPIALYERIAYEHMGCRLELDTIDRQLKTEIEETRSILTESAAAMAPGQSWQEVVEALPLPTTSDGARGIYQKAIAELSQHCSLKGLFGPELTRQCPVAVEPIPDYMRPVRSNAAYSMPPVHPPRGGTFYILDTGANTPAPAEYRLLAAHETYPGHHLLDTSRWQHGRPVRRQIEFPLFYEGWASFGEELLFDTGFFSSPKDHLLMAKRRFWRAVRGKVDFDIHTRRKTPKQAAAFLTSLGMDSEQVMAMIRRYSLKPGYQLSYTIGRNHFRRLYDDFCLKQKDPAAFARLVLAQGEIGFDHLEQQLQQGDLA